MTNDISIDHKLFTSKFVAAEKVRKEQNEPSTFNQHR